MNSEPCTAHMESGKGLDICEPLKTIADELMKLGGIDIHTTRRWISLCGCAAPL